MQRWLLSLDVISVLVFVAAGRTSHATGESAAGLLHTAGPFLLALGAGWLVMRAWTDPAALRTGLGVAAVTIAGGMVLRRFAFGEGTAPSFVLVAAGFLTLFLVGWRLAVRAGRRARRA